jgi:sn-glycerol 3-phosphate transport system permease protein
METSDLGGATTTAVVGDDAPVIGAGGPPRVAGSNNRQLLSTIGQYAVLVVLATIVLAPLLLTLRMALSPPFKWVGEGGPWHPVDIAWKDRTWFSGGVVSVVLRTLVLGFLFAWMHRASTGRSWKEWLSTPTPASLVAVIGGTVVTAITASPVLTSLHAADGKSGLLFLVCVLAVAVTQVVGFLPGRRPIGAILLGVSAGALLAGATIIAVGPVVWTQSWSANNLGGGMVRSLIMAVLITICQVLTAILAAYAFVYLEFPFRRIIFGVFMATLLLPLEVTLIANIATIQRMQWFNTYQGLVLPFAASAIGIFLIHQGFRGVPKDLRDAAQLDGYGHMRYLFLVAVPLTRPVVASFTVIAALQAWNQYLWPRSVIDNNSFNTLQLQLRQVATADPSTANVAVAAALVAAVPVLVLLIAFQRHIVRGLTAGAVK